MIFWRGEGSRRAGAGLRFAEEWAAEEILDQVGSRLAAGRGLLDIKICMPTRQGIVCGRLKASRRICRVQSRYGSPPGRSFCAYKRNQNTLGAAPQDPDASEPPRPESQRNGFPERDETTLIRLIFNLVSAGTHIKCAAGYLWSASVRSTDLDFSPQKNLNPYPAQLSVKGVCQGGSSVPLDRVLVPFTRVKGTPPRRAVLTMPLQKAPRRRQATTNLV